MTRVTIRLDFDGARHLGHGKIRLLELIEAHGSISSAARAMGMSYRRAWLLADEANRMFSAPLFATRMGGKGGGQAQLTPFGRELIALYRRMEKEAERSFGAEIEKLASALATPAQA
ncbi:MAG: winged helix-turn-helix domain-containing protein [Beijerinckiaceae bacterium]|jgi:molybdate transport system regulatory protein